jgi:hypothetical protein
MAELTALQENGVMAYLLHCGVVLMLATLTTPAVATPILQSLQHQCKRLLKRSQQQRLSG